MKTVFKTLAVLCIGFALTVAYDRLATAYHLPFPPNWLGYLLRADSEFFYDMAILSLFIDLQVLAFLIWGLYGLVNLVYNT